MFICGFLIGCARQPLVPVDFMPAKVSLNGEAPTYNQVVERHNARVGGLGRLWSRSEVKVAWEDEDGKRRREKGEGNVIFVRDVNGTGKHGVAVTLGKLGQTMLWAGSDGTRFWVFDLRGDKSVQVGPVSDSPEALGATVPPDAVPLLLGVLPAQPLEADEPVTTLSGYYVLRPTPRAVMLLHPRTLLPARVIVLDERGRESLVSYLDRYEPVKLSGVAERDAPRIATHIDLYLPAAPSHAELKLSGMTDQKIKPGVFDFGTLMKTYQPAEVQHIAERQVIGRVR